MRDEKGNQDFIVINLDDKFEVLYWTKKFGVTHDILKRAVREVGSSSRAVQIKLRR
ncbi:DUF3606 domain-containing protein [Pseudomonas sp. NPDC090202]|uniref:DUF3606 domain-containing protein n=1 Tax=unclassified Pseudomonas TaxID=196821 RepID=UPI0038016428